MNKYVIGLDYGSDSCRAIIVDAANGNEIASSVKYYPRWMKGSYCDPRSNRYRQHPLDYIEVLEESIREALSKSPEGTAEKVVGMGFDTTGSTPVLTDEQGTPLALLPAFAENPNAMFVLWKDHTAVKEADEINKLAKEWETDYTAFEGGIYSSEWVWAKMLHILREDETVRKAAYSWVEHCDWLPGLITGNTKPETMPRSRCAAGHKAMWHPDWKGLPGEDFLERLDPLLINFRKRLFRETFTSDTCVGYLTPEWASRLGLSTRVAVAAGAFDCHMGAVGAGIKPHMLVKSIGTSTCDIMVATHEDIGRRQIPGICGQVDGSVLPGMIGLEAGQSAFGDIFAWFRQILEWPLVNILPKTTLISEELMEKMGIRIYGCDTCQLICPKNKGVKKSTHREFIPELIKESEGKENLFGNYLLLVNNPKKKYDNGKNMSNLVYSDSPMHEEITDVDSYIFANNEKIGHLYSLFGSTWKKEELLAMNKELDEMIVQYGGSRDDMAVVDLYSEVIQAKWLSKKAYNENDIKNGKAMSELRQKLLKDNGLLLQDMKEKQNSQSFGVEIDYAEDEPIIPNKKYFDIDGINFMFQKFIKHMERFVKIDKSPVDEDYEEMQNYVETHPEYFDDSNDEENKQEIEEE